MTGLARCVGDVDRFLASCWGRAPLHRQGVDPARFADIFSLDDVDRFVSTSFPRLPAFRLVKDGSPLDPSRYTKTARIGGQAVAGVGDPGRVFEEFRLGATLVLQGLQRSSETVARFCRSLEHELTHPVQANAYVTPAGAQGLGVHYDTHDVFVLQLAGRKEWAVYEPVLDDPLPSQGWHAGRGEPGPPILEVELRAGDCLYMPRGFLHSARAQQEMSAHLTVGVLTQTWFDVLREVVAGAADDPVFRRSLPAGFATDETALAAGVEAAVARLRDWLEKVDTAQAAGAVVQRYWASRPPILAGQLHQLLALDGIGDDTVVRRRDGSVCHLVVDADRMTVHLGDRRLVMSADLEPALRRVATGRPVRLGDLGDVLDQPSRAVLARRLVREGLLEMVLGN
ncbi:MAG: cupin domain-containing protein [Actinomycetota bacterium]|nr:cupin domain-containing protein [Actinomycetota bacterium]